MAERKGPADVVVLTDIIRQVLSVDSDFQDNRAAWADAPSEDVCYYLWRRKLLSRAGRSGRLTVGGKFDRRGDYLAFRERELQKRFLQKEEAEEAPKTPTKPARPLANTAAPVSPRSNAELFAFAGMHHIFGDQKSPVLVVKFANDTKDLLAYGCGDGTVHVCGVVTRPGRIALLKGHMGAITDIDWGITNDFLVSSAQDRTVRLWQSRCGLCTRVIEVPQVCGCCAFHPLNNNFFAAGTKAPKGGKGLAQVVNFSTGRAASSIVTGGAVRSLAFDAAGNFLFTSDDSGTLTTFKVSPNGILQALFKREIGTVAWSLEFKGWYHSGKYLPMLLAACKDSSAKVFRVGSKPVGEVMLERALPMNCSKQPIRAKFCPLLATRPSACIVTGGEDCCLYIYDLGRRDVKPINKLQGHGATVHDVSWSYDETLLASCAADGTVYIWKRVLQVSTS